MNSTQTVNSSEHVDDEYKAAIDGYLLEMERLRDDMAARQKRIDNTQAETRDLLAELRKLRAA